MLVVAGCSSEKPAHRSRVQEQPTGPLTLHMRNCPSAVHTARTTAKPTEDGVDVEITSSDPAARTQIVALTEMQTSLRAPLAGLPMHTGTHAGPGTVGHCPLIRVGTTLTYEQIPDGVRVHVAVQRPEDVALIQRATENRVRDLSAPSS
jgi:TusA-related sulfurtransferase